MPAYVPYPVPYAVTSDDDNYADSTDSRAVPATYDRAAWEQDTGSRWHAPARDPRVRAVPSTQKESLASLSPDEVAPVAAQPATILVYKDGHKMEVQNYAIVGDTLFNLTGNLSHKILLADLDLSATQKLNDERGVEFQVPAQKTP